MGDSVKIPDCLMRRAPISMGPCRLNSGALCALADGLYCSPVASGVPPWPPTWGKPALFPGSASAELPCQLFTEIGKIWTCAMCTSCHSKEVSTPQVGCTAETRELNRPGGCRACGICLGIGNRGLVPARLPMRDAAGHGVQHFINVYSGPQLQPPIRNQNNA